MNNLNGRSVLKVMLHETAHAFNLGSVPTTFGPELGGRPNASVITLTDLGVHVKGTSQQGDKFEFVLPLAACKLIQLNLE